MDDDSGPTAYIIFGILLLVNMFFYGFDAALNELNVKEVERRAEEEKDKKSIRLMKMLGNPHAYVNALQLITTLVDVIIGACYLGMCKSFTEKLLLQVNGIAAGVAAVAATILTTLFLLYIILTLGTVLPKKIAARMPERMAHALATPMYFAANLLLPFTELVTVTAKGILYLFGFRDNGDEKDMTEEEIINMVNEGHEQGIIQASEAEMISNIFEFGDKEVQDIMTHRNNIVAVDGDMLLKDAVAFMLAEKNSRFPVYEENIDCIIGILHLKDAMRFHTDNQNADCPIKNLQGLLREPHFVPQTKNIDELFQEMQSKKLQMVIVVDEYGQTDGLVAMEDILEEIVGNIMDEYDEDKEYIEDKGNHEYVIEGKTPLEELEERFGLTFDTEEFETLNGFLIGRLDRIPEPDEEFETDYNGYRFKILSVENKMIQSVLVSALEEKSN